MTTCGDQVCGTGGFTGPQPGDPGNNSVLSAVSVFGGIEVSWTFPTVNAHAVAHTLLYRGVSTNRDAALLLRVVGGSAYYDRVDSSTTYYYWIRIVSANTGQPGDWIGPASATAKPLIEDMIEQLTGEIDKGVLAQSLKTDIDRITQNAEDLAAAIADRLEGDLQISLSVNEVDTGLATAFSSIAQEVTDRVAGHALLASSIETVAAATESNLALIQTETSAITTELESLANQITTVGALTASNGALIQDTITAQATTNSSVASRLTSVEAASTSQAALIQTNAAASVAADSALATRIDTVQAANASTLALVQQETSTRTSETGALASQLSVVGAATASNASYIQSVETAFVTADSALSGRIDSVVTTTANNAALIQSETQTRTTQYSSLASQLTAIGAVTDNNAALITANQSAQATVNSAVAQDLTEIRAATEDNAAAILVANTAITNNYNTLAGQVTTVQSTLGDSIASVQTGLQTNINTLNGKVTSIGALYTAKVSVEGLIGGFGIYNDGSEVEAGFDVDKFWIGRTSANKRKPFIVSDGVVYIDEAAINKLTFSKLRNEDGSFVVVDGKLDGNKVNALPAWLNSTITIAANGQLQGAGGGAVTISGLGFTGSLNADKTSENTAAGIAGQGTLATQNTVSTGQVTGLGALATSDNVFIGSTVRMPGGAVLNTGDFVNALSKINSSNISTFMESAAIADAYIGNLHGSKIIANTITASQMAAGSITAGNAAIANLAVGTLQIANEAVTIPRSASGTYSATVWMSVPYAANFHIIATFTQGSSRDGELIYLAVDGAIVTGEAPQDGTTGAMGAIAYLTPGSHSVSVYAANNVGGMACTLLVLGCMK